MSDEATVELTVPEMDCASCADTVEGALRQLEGVTAVDPRPTPGVVSVTYDPDAVDINRLVDSIEGVGYAVEDGDGVPAARENVWTSRRAIKTWIGAAFLAAGLVLAFVVPGGDATIVDAGGVSLSPADLAYLVAVAASGLAILRGGYYAAKAKSLGIDLLMSLAIVGALLASLLFGQDLYVEAATLAVLFSIAELLEDYAMDRARGSLRALMDLSPDTARVRRDDGETTVPAQEVETGDVVLVRPGEKIPVDGTVTEGASPVDQSPITGESVPVDKTVGDTVYAGSILEGGYLEIEATAPGTETTLSRVVELVEDAQAERTEREAFVDRFADYYTPLVVGFAVLVTVVPPLVFGGAWATYFVYGLTLLVLACPCAFVISTPVTVVSGVTSAARNGVLVKGGSHLETVGEVDAVAFDKTGTLTTGDLAVTDVVPLAGNSTADVLACAHGLETRSEHPIGAAIVDHADAADIDTDQTIEDFEALTGQGVTATLDGEPHYAGTPTLFEDLGFDLSHVHATTDGGVVTATASRLCEQNNCLDLLEDTVPALQAEGKTAVLVGTEDSLEGVIAVADQVRPEAEWVIERLHAQGVEEVVMVTGDNERTATAIGEAVGVDRVAAEVLPAEKVEVIEDLVAEYEAVAMVGDGVNDAPALATADVGIAMGAAGTDTALETGDIALLRDDLAALPYLHRLAGRTTRVIRQNVWSSLGVKAGLAALVPLGLVPIWVAVLVGDAGMTSAITANAMRLGTIKAETPPTDRR
ncbi:MAG: heavy metal translocating P-type ATPase [Halobacteriaceae archaeon]